MVSIMDKRALTRFIILIGVMLIIIIASYNALAIKADSEIGGYIALIIDDFGNAGEGRDAMLQLGIPITVAIMPFMPYSFKEADAARNAGLDVILHIPMEPIKGKKEWLGPRKQRDYIYRCFTAQ